MAQFYITGTNLGFDLRRCNDSRDRRETITIVGTNKRGELRTFTGIVQSVEDFCDAPLERRWRVTIPDAT
jgi:hypothetical protein